MEVGAAGEVTAMSVDARNATLWQLILAKPRSPTTALTRFHSLASYVCTSLGWGHGQPLLCWTFRVNGLCSHTNGQQARRWHAICGLFSVASHSMARGL